MTLTALFTYTGTMDGQVGFKPSDPFWRTTNKTAAQKRLRLTLQTEKKQNCLKTTEQTLTGDMWHVEPFFQDQNRKMSAFFNLPPTLPLTLEWYKLVSKGPAQCNSLKT